MFKVLSLFTFLTLFSCAQTSSEDIETSGIQANYDIEAEDTSVVKCKAIFTVGEGIGGTFIELTNGDNVQCNGVPMVKTELFGIVNYIAYVPYQVGKTYKVEFERPEKAEKFTSTVEMPPRPIITSPVENQSLQKSINSATITWGASSIDSARIEIEYQKASQGRLEWTSSSTYQSPETGSETLLLGFDGTVGRVAGKTIVRRERRGNHTTAMPGNINAYNSDEVNIFFED